ncbi:hypothetical protein [Mycobacterium paraintracellulare]
MADDFENDPHFIDIQGPVGGESLGIMTRNAFNLHLHACLHSISNGRPGFVSDEYLNDIEAETTIAAAELETAGVWERRQGGYRVVADDVLKIALRFNEHAARKEAECAERRRHLPKEADGSAWVVCLHCGIPLQRPDDGPVALPNGGPLGPDGRAG